MIPDTTTNERIATLCSLINAYDCDGIIKFTPTESEVNAKYFGRPMLWYAIRRSNQTIVDILRACGADVTTDAYHIPHHSIMLPEAPDAEQDTDTAMKKIHDELPKGTSVLATAVYYNRPAIVKLLLKCGAMPRDTITIDGVRITCAEYAKTHGYANIAKMLYVAQMKLAKKSHAARK